MHTVTIEIIDNRTGQRDALTLSGQDIERIRRTAGSTPASALLVRLLETMVQQKGYEIHSSKAHQLEAARLILADEAGTIHLFARRGAASATPAGPLAAPAVPTAQASATQAQPYAAVPSRMHLVQYNDLPAERERLAQAIRERDYIPVFWSKTQGLRFKELARRFPLPVDPRGRALHDPKSMLSFILQKPNYRIAYVLEDFHHYIGAADAISPDVGEVRSLLKDLHQSLASREESLHFLVPESFSPPEEIKSLFAIPEGEAGGASPILDRFGQLLTDAGHIAHTKPVIGVDSLVQRLIQILCQMEANNPLLIGHPGVGKTAIVEGLARAIAQGKVPRAIAGRKLYALSLNSLVAGTRYRGDLEARLDGLMREVFTLKDRLIIFIDEMHTLLHAGSAEGAPGMADVLKPVLARGEFPCIGATTWEGERAIAADPALSRRFKKIIVPEPDKELAVRILQGIAPSFEEHHGLAIGKDALLAAVELGIEHLPDTYLPGKAVALLDGAASFCALQGKRRVQRLDILAELDKMKRYERIP